MRDTIRSTTLKTFIAISVAHALADCAGGVWPMFKKLAEIDLRAAGVIATVGTIIGCTLQPFFGHWADRGRARTCVLLGAWLAMASLLFGPIARYLDVNSLPVWGLLLVIMVTIRTGQAMYHPAGASLAGSTATKRRSTFVSLYIMCGMIGFSLSHLSFSVVYDWLDQRTEWLFVPLGLVMLGVGWWCRPRESKHEEPPSLGAMLRPLWNLRRKLFALYIMLSLVSGVGFGWIFIMPEFAEGKEYATWIVNGGGMLAMVFGSAVVIIPVAMLADRFGRKRVIIVTLTIGIALFYLVVAGPRLPEWAFLALLFLAGGFTGCPNPLGVAHGQALDVKHSSMITGVLMGLAWALGAIGPTIVGFLAKQPTLRPEGALMWTGIGYFVALGFALWIPRTPRHADGEPAIPADA